MTATEAEHLTTPPPAKKQRGRESVLDMVRSLGVVMLVVLPLWFFAQPSASDKKSIRPEDPAPDISAFTQDTPGVPVVRATPQGWVVNVADYDQKRLRIGYVIDADQYVEFAAGAGDQWLADQTAQGKPAGTVDVAGVRWELLRATTSQESLVRTVGATTLIVGGLRETASLAEIKKLAATVR